MNKDTYTLEEKIELFKNDIEKVVNSSDLPFSVIYPIFKLYSIDIEKEYYKNKRSIIDGINLKLSKKNEEAYSNTESLN